MESLIVASQRLFGSSGRAWAWSCAFPGGRAKKLHKWLHKAPISSGMVCHITCSQHSPTMRRSKTSSQRLPMQELPCSVLFMITRGSDSESV